MPLVGLIDITGNLPVGVREAAAPSYKGKELVYQEPERVSRKELSFYCLKV